MSKINKIVAVLLSVVFVIGLCCFFAGCEDDEEKKYDVALMIVRREENLMEHTGERWIIDKDKTYINIDQKYDGKSYVYYVYAYNLPDHPDFGDIWFNYEQGVKIDFPQKYERKPVNDTINYINLSVGSSKGEHTAKIYVQEDSKLFNGKQIEVRIVVK